jgi:transposase
MTSKRQPYKIYTQEFKLEAVRLMAQSDKPASEIAVELGIRRNQLYKWKEQLASKGRPLKENQSEVSTFQKENNRLREEIEILKRPL